MSLGPGIWPFWGALVRVTQLGGWYPQSVVSQPTKVGWGSESCWLGQELFGWGPNEKKVVDWENIEKRIETFIVHCGFKKFVFVKNGAIFAFFPSFLALLGVRTEKT